MKIVEFTKEGLIVKALMEGPHRYKELKKATELSNAWLSKKLQELLNLGMIYAQNGYYHLNPERLQEALKKEKTHIARMIAQEIIKTYKVEAIILFGSLARNQQRDADIDLLVITTENFFNPLQVSIQLFRRFAVAVDIVHLTLKEFLKWLHDKPPLLFGLLTGYKILYDKGYIKPFLGTLKREIHKEWVYIQEKEAWLKKKLLPHI